ncbi:integrase [Candidatus Woesearchaeota archaeon CG10_big_fil_rev_8_21_14_0_10_36_11]|nr:MAG: integrase [Candidatus Woesearchaeota archaeon CG10_big_fil_rev_8_21_14_0_10_36_11]
MSFQRLQQELKIRRCSPRTTKVYVHYNTAFLKFCKKCSHEVNRQDVRNYLEHLADKRCSGATMRLAFNALLFYYRNILQTNIMYGITIPKRDQKITVALTKEEVIRLINVITNPKHKLLIELIYGSGLRASEAVKIKYKNILVNEKILIIRSGKGRKDRKTIISDKFIKSLNEENNADTYIFPGRKGHLTIRSIQAILKQAAQKAGIKKNVYPHLLRHSFATHLDENGVKTRHLKKILGHKDQKTTDGYIYDSGKELKSITSPYDTI